MVSCSAIGCTNRSSNKEIRFYQVPTPETNPVLCQKWLHNIRRDGELPKHKSFYICSDHFEEECFQCDLQVSSSIFIKHFLSC